MKPKTMILMIVAVGCGLAASIMTSRLLAERKDKEQAEPTVPVLVARARTTGWMEIKDPEKLFERKEYPVSLSPKNPVGEYDKLKGKKLNKNMPEGQALTEADLLSKEQQSISDQLLPGQRATAIKVDARSLAGGFVLPGARVDIVLTAKTRSGVGTTRTVLQHVLVMAIDNQDTRDPEKRHILGQTVTVAATPQEASRLSLAGSLGELGLQVKNPGDNSRISPVLVTEEDLNRAPPPSGDRPDELAKADATPAVPTITLPPVTAEEKKEEEKPKEPEAPKVVAVEEKPPEKPKRHVMRIQSGAEAVKVIFTLGEKDPDEDEGEGDGGSLLIPEFAKGPSKAKRPGGSNAQKLPPKAAPKSN